MQKIKDFVLRVISITSFGRLYAGYYFLQKNHLTKSGWKKSVVKRLPIDKHGKALPWFTYGAIHFLEPKLNKNFRVFEYGSGNSTMWFSKKVASITSVEHDEKWFHSMKSKFLAFSNISYSNQSIANTSYSDEILSYEREFDIIVLDGRQRVQCAKNSLKALKDSGVIIWDNADRAKYQKGYDFLLSKGFKRIDFYGTGPISAHSWSTAIFYKTVNCLAL